MNYSHYPLLEKVDTPTQLRQLNLNELQTLSRELRDFLVESVSQSGGHFASGLGVVELTIALHYVFNTPEDHLIWDVGHQAYPHKILTGRREQMSTIRSKDGLHPFPWREESPYDALSTGHSSTSISAGLGMSIGDKLNGNNNRTLCVIGDGALTAGMAFEALNHAGHLKTDLIVICNDNDMSISHSVGALSHHLAQLISSEPYTRFRENSKKILEHIQPVKQFFKKAESHIKDIIAPSAFMEEFGFNYIGPIDGHNLPHLIEILSRVRHLKGPQFVHVITKKGKGHLPAEQDPIAWHGIAKQTSQETIKPTTPNQKTYSQIFGEWLCAKAEIEPKLVAITPAMCEGSGMVQFSKRFPERFFDVAIAEQHAVTFAAGLATTGVKPVVAIYSTFLQRAYDQVIHDIAIQNLPVIFAIDRAGIVGEDGATHQGLFDLSYLRAIPNLTIITPSRGELLIDALNWAYQHNGPVAIRYPKGKSSIENRSLILPNGNFQQSEVISEGKNIAIINFGHLLPEAIIAAQTLEATLIDMRFVKPLDEERLRNIAKTHSTIVTLEENVVSGGAGSAVAEFLATVKYSGSLLQLGLPDEFIPQGTQSEIRVEFGLTSDKILQKIEQFMRH